MQVFSEFSEYLQKESKPKQFILQNKHSKFLILDPRIGQFCAENISLFCDVLFYE